MESHRELSFSQLFFFALLWAGAPARGDDSGLYPGGFDDAAAERFLNGQRRDALVAWHDQLVDRLNYFFNRSKIYAKIVNSAPNPISERGEEELRMAIARLQDTAWCDALKVGAPRTRVLERVAEEFDLVQSELRGAEEEWLRANGAISGVADALLDANCRIEHEKNARPMDAAHVEYYKKLIKWCKNGPHLVLKGTREERRGQRLKHCFQDAAKERLAKAPGGAGEAFDPTAMMRPELLRNLLEKPRESGASAADAALPPEMETAKHGEAKENKSGSPGKPSNALPEGERDESGAAPNEAVEEAAFGIEAGGSPPARISEERMKELRAHLQQQEPELLSKIEQEEKKDPEKEEERKRAQKQIQRTLEKDARDRGAKPLTESELAAFARQEIERAIRGEASGADYIPFLLSIEKTDANSGDLKNVAYGDLLAAAERKFEEYSAIANRAGATPRERRNAIARAMNADFVWKYTKVLARLADFLVGRGGDCDAETRMMISFYQRGKTALGPDEALGAQKFGDHLQPVIWNAKARTVENMITGEVLDGVVTEIYRPAVIPYAYLASVGKEDESSLEKLVLAKADPKLLEQAKQLQKGKVPAETSETNSTLKYPAAEVYASLGAIPDQAVISYSDSGKPRSAEAFLKSRATAAPNRGKPAKKDDAAFSEAAETHAPGITPSAWASVKSRVAKGLKAQWQSAEFDKAFPIVAFLEEHHALPKGDLSVKTGPPAYDFTLIKTKLGMIVKSEGLKDALRLQQDPSLLLDAAKMSDERLEGIVRTLDLLSDVLDSNKNLLPGSEHRKEEGKKEFFEAMKLVVAMPEFQALQKTQREMKRKVIQNPEDFLHLWEALPSGRADLLDQIYAERYQPPPEFKDFDLLKGSQLLTNAAIILASRGMLNFRRELAKEAKARPRGAVGRAGQGRHAEKRAEAPDAPPRDDRGALPFRRDQKARQPIEALQNIKGGDRESSAREGGGDHPRSRDGGPQNTEAVLLDASKFEELFAKYYFSAYIDQSLSVEDRNAVEAARLSEKTKETFTVSRPFFEALLAQKELSRRLVSAWLMNPEFYLNHYQPGPTEHDLLHLGFASEPQEGVRVSYMVDRSVIRFFIRLLKSAPASQMANNPFAQHYGGNEKAIQALEALLRKKN